MQSPITPKQKLLRLVSRIQQNDKNLADELEYVRGKDETKNEARNRETVFESLNTEETEAFGPGISSPDFALETIVLRVGRPVLTISNNEALLDFRDAESQVWRERLINAKQQLIGATRAVGRIELENDPSYEWVGTGWLVDENIIVSNRHVAEIFGMKNGSRFIFRQGLGGRTVKASIDFLEEYNRPDELTFNIVRILHIEDANGPDISLLQVDVANRNTIAEPIKLSGQLTIPRQQVAAIGYPAKDSRIPDQQLMIDIFGDIYDKKRLAPGQIINSSPNEVLHDCSTLGGNSGSALIDLVSGQAVGLHFAGRFLESNFAVPSATIKERVARFKSAGGGNIPPSAKPTERISTGGGKPSTTHQAPNAQQVATFSIPLNISVSVGTAVLNGAQQSAKSDVQAGKQDTEDEEFFTEAIPEDYSDRQGYEVSFLGSNRQVPLPRVTDPALKNDILSFNIDGEEKNVLDYQHFSVMMCESRRLCFFSAVNIDGKRSTSMNRGPWRLDPRIPKEAQIMKECYGNSPKFSRGHMTRREDPIWGDENEASQGNSDSMHVTNTVPQMQSMNAGIWLRLENYALQNAKKDDMRISVFTGPVFSEDDPEKFGVVIPLSFWKVIAFIHDETNKLCATGYRISQEDFLEEEEFVFGKHGAAQVSISSIEQATGLSFGDLSQVDPFVNETESLPGPLRSLGEIRFV